MEGLSEGAYEVEVPMSFDWHPSLGAASRVVSVYPEAPHGVVGFRLR
jgi:hypothetical protein